MTEDEIGSQAVRFPRAGARRAVLSGTGVLYGGTRSEQSYSQEPARVVCRFRQSAESPTRDHVPSTAAVSSSRGSVWRTGPLATPPLLASPRLAGDSTRAIEG
jgi:hypothetical protein